MKRVSAWLYLTVAALSGLMLAPALAQTPVSNAITYQGELKASGQLASGPVDLRFALFDSAAAGTQVGPMIERFSVPLDDGRFAQSLDFGPSAFDSESRWLEISVRGPAGNGTFVTLTPRQPLTAAPYALKVQGIDGHSLDAPNGGPENAVIVDAVGNVGVGTPAPTRPLHVVEPDIFTAKFEGAHTAAAAVEIRNTSSDTTWELGVTGSSAPLGFPAGSMYIYKQGEPSRGLALTPSGSLMLSANEFVPRAEEQVRIIRGGVNIGGAALVGSGFTSTQVSTGVYRITFNTGFPGQPTTVASPLFIAGEPPVIAMVGPYSSSGVDVEIRRTTDGALVSRPFRFIVMGTR